MQVLFGWNDLKLNYANLILALRNLKCHTCQCFSNSTANRSCDVIVSGFKTCISFKRALDFFSIQNIAGARRSCLCVVTTEFIKVYSAELSSAFQKNYFARGVFHNVFFNIKHS